MSETADPSLAKPLGKYPFFKRAGNFIYLSGVSARLPDGSIAGTATSGEGSAPDVRIQTRTVLEKIRAILADAGAELSDCVEITVFLTNMEDFPAYNQVYGQYFDATGPARTTVGVRELPHPHMVVEMRAVAFLKGRA
jgi:2-aminomuconate deaminase